MPKLNYEIVSHSEFPKRLWARQNLELDEVTEKLKALDKSEIIKMKLATFKRARVIRTLIRKRLYKDGLTMRSVITKREDGGGILFMGELREKR